MGFGWALTLLQFWRQIALIGLIASAYGWHWNEVRKARNAGFEMCQVKASEDLDRRLKNALDSENRAGDRPRSNGGILSDDGHKRPD